ncbi:hypothetical protein PFISCL1PPCAC_2946, partial [Pristionchus fissidentatus]
NQLSTPFTATHMLLDVNFWIECPVLSYKSAVFSDNQPEFPPDFRLEEFRRNFNADRLRVRGCGDDLEQFDYGLFGFNIHRKSE